MICLDRNVSPRTAKELLWGLEGYKLGLTHFTTELNIKDGSLESNLINLSLK